MSLFLPGKCNRTQQLYKLLIRIPQNTFSQLTKNIYKILRKIIVDIDAHQQNYQRLENSYNIEQCRKMKYLKCIAGDINREI